MEPTMAGTATAAAHAPGPVQHQGASQFSRLPDALLACILQAVPQRERLASSATVCSSWAAAATAATVDVDLPRAFQQVIAAFQPWLQQHAGQLTSLKVATGFYLHNKLCLPCGKLQRLTRLDLKSIDLQLDNPTEGGRSSSASTASVLPNLKELKLVDCYLNHSTMLQLPQLSGVTRLKLKGLDHLPLAKHAASRAAVKHLLQHLPAVARLSLSGVGSPADIMPALSASSITAFTWDASVEYAQQHSKDADFLSTPPFAHLRKLKLLHVQLSPAVLSNTPLLTRLQLADCTLLQLEQPGAADVAGASALLAAVRGMRQIQHLSLAVRPNRDWANLQDPPSAFAIAQPCDCAALTSSPHLTHLELSIDGSTGRVLPTGALQHMLPAGRQLPQLQQLVLRWEHHYDWSEGRGGSISTADLCSMISACPGLCSLDLRGVVAGDADVSPLLQLPATCRSLKVGGHPFGDRAAGVIGQLTQLTHLEWSCAPGLTDAGLLSLTALYGLQSFLMCENNNLTVVPKEGGVMYDEFQVTTGYQCVAQQLFELLRRAPCSGLWMERLDQQQQLLRQQLALACFMGHAMDVVMSCSANPQVGADARSMADIGRRLLAGDVVGGSDAVPLHANMYLQLQARVRWFCCTDRHMTATLANMEAAVMWAVRMSGCGCAFPGMVRETELLACWGQLC